jgi:ABC-type Zn2+ transport system substrate-binding protein/surface adhesin
MPVPLISVLVQETSMNNTEHAHSIGDDHNSHGQTPYWRRAHHDWRFWLGPPMLVAIAVYVGTNDLSMVPSGRQKQMPTGSRVP